MDLEIYRRDTKLPNFSLNVATLQNLNPEQENLCSSSIVRLYTDQCPELTMAFPDLHLWPPEFGKKDLTV